MAEGTATVTIDRPVDEVWDLVGKFGDLDTWMAGVEECRVEGDLRHLSVLGMAITERLVDRSDDARTITYAITEAPLPVESHSATIAVRGDGSATTVSWTVRVEPDELGDLFAQTYQGALDQLKARLES